MTLLTFNVIKILALSALGAFIALLFGNLLIKFLNEIKFWKKEARKKTITGEPADVFYSLHKEKEVTVPRGGGLLVWLTLSFLICLFFFLSYFQNPWWLEKFNFLSRKETWLPFFTLIIASLVGLVDDILVVFGKGKYIGGGLTFIHRLLIVSLIGLIGSIWFYGKLDWQTIHIPLVVNFPEGIDIPVAFGNFLLQIPFSQWYIPISLTFSLLFILVMIASWAGGVVDGLDGLAGGVFSSIFAAFSIIAFSQGKIDLAAFCAVIAGALFAFLWFNVPPAKFYMGETGVLGLTSTMAVVAFLTDSVVILPIIAGVMVMEVGSIIVQLISKKFFHKKIWLCTPIHHHFEAKGWPAHQVTMRFWILSVVFAIIGVAISLLSYRV